MLLAYLLILQAQPAPPGPPPAAGGQVTCPDGALVREGGNCPRFVFFDSGKAEIRREWEPVIEEAAAASRSGSRLLVVGHSDRTGSAAINRAMARSRARAVAAALQARGVAAERITVEARGEEEPLVATADGVREIQNRRVLIHLRP